MQNHSDIRVKLTKDNPNIPYLMFANNCIILCRTTKKAVRNVKEILDYYY